RRPLSPRPAPLKYASLLLAAALLAAAPLANADAAKPVELTKSWTPIPLPEVAVAVVAHGDQLWAVGENEMIAVSSDHARSWTIKHSSKPGEMLSGLVFVGDKTAYAFSSGRSWMKSTDGGNSWKTERGWKQTWIAGGFGDANLLVAVNGDSWGYSSDLGKHWAVNGLPLPADPLAPPTKMGVKLPKPAILHTLERRPMQVLALDGKRAAVLFAPESGAQPWISTADGGKSWQMSGLDQTMTLTSMRSEAGKFLVYGVGKDGSPQAMASADAASWDPAPAPLGVYTLCTDQGCLMPGGWAQLDGAKPLAWQLPNAAEGEIAVSWAASGDAFCQVANSRLDCTVARAAWTKPAPMPTEVDFRTLQAANWLAPELPGDNHDGMVMVRVVVGADGKLKSIQPLGGEWGDLGAAVVKGLKPWHFAPVTVAGIAAEVVATIPYIAIAKGDIDGVNASAPRITNACCQRP